MSDYHDRIMNIPTKNKEKYNGQYKRGHRDARHAAAEIANEADVEIAALKAEIENLRKNAEYWYNERNKEIKKISEAVEGGHNEQPDKRRHS